MEGCNFLWKRCICSPKNYFRYYATGNTANLFLYKKGASSASPTKGTLSITNPGSIIEGTSGTFAYSLTGGSENTLTSATWSSDDSSVINITNASTGAYTAAGEGTATIIQLVMVPQHLVLLLYLIHLLVILKSQALPHSLPGMFMLYHMIK